MITPETKSLVTSDGIRLDADIYHPGGPGPYPVLLMRQPYGRRIASTVTYAHPSWYANHGYIVVIQDVRGRGSSEGNFELLKNECSDGRETLDWVVDIPGSDGQVGMYGFSYQGMTQLMAAHTNHDALKTICPAMAGADLYHDWAYEGGVFRLFNSLTWAAQLSAETARRDGDAMRYADRYELGHEPSIGALMSAAEGRTRQRLGDSFFNAWIDEPQESDYWRERSAVPLPSDTKLSTLHIGGWYDAFLTGTLRTFEHFKRLGNSAENELVIGPWGHLPWSPQIGNHDYGPSGESFIDELQIRWFDRQLKGVSKDAITTDAPVQLFDVEVGEWVESFGWPPPTQLYRLDLDSGGLAGARQNHGTLTDGQAGKPEPDTIVSDPWRPVPSKGGTTGPQSGRFERQDIDARPDVATYTSEPLKEELIISGTVELQLDISADINPFHVHVVLSIAEPFGSVWNLTSGSLRVDVQSSIVTVSLRPIYAKIVVGKSLRVSISGADWPAMALPQSSGRTPGAASALDYPIVTLSLNAGEGISTLLMPVVTKTKSNV